MKPVIKKQTHYNLLLMRDDGGARTFRVHSTTLRVVIITFLLLIAGGGAGIYGGIHYWRKYQVLSKNYTEQKDLLAEARTQLQSLVHLKSVIVASNSPLPHAKNEEVGVPLPPSHLPNASQNATVSSPEAGTGAPQVQGTQANAAEANPADSVGGTGTGVQGAGDAPAPSTGPQESVLPSLESDGSPLRIGGFTVRVSTQQRLRISYDLSTAAQDGQRVVTGEASYYAVFADGAQVQLSHIESDGSRFAIARRKPMSTGGRLPQERKASDVVSLNVVIELADGQKYQDTFPVSN